MLVLKRNLKKGFTLVELLVTISIFVILTGVVLFNQSKFNSTILLTNLAYDTALTIRQAQTYGINIKEFNAGSGGLFVPYGVHFDRTENKSFILFADTEFDLLSSPTVIHPYSGAVDRCNAFDGCVSRYSIKRGNIISDLCVVEGVDCNPVDSLDLIFKRPNPDANIFGDGTGGKTKAIITLMGVDGSTRKVNVQANGLIEIVN